MSVCFECGVHVVVVDTVELHVVGCSKSSAEAEEFLTHLSEDIDRHPSTMLLMSAGERGVLAAKASLRAGMSGEGTADSMFLDAIDSDMVGSLLSISSLAGATQMFSILSEQGLIDEDAFSIFEASLPSSSNEW